MADFYNEIYKLKQILRRGWILRNIPNRTESDAEHCFSMIMVALEIMAKNNLKLDQLKVLKMIAYHEVGEVDVGDIVPQDNIDLKEKHNKEFDCVKRISEKYKIPEILALWIEYEENKTPEAQFVRKLDKFDCVLQSKVYSELCDKPEIFEEFKTKYKDFYDELIKKKK